ncbi:putative leader peptide [Actinomycetospora cinnamomea]
MAGFDTVRTPDPMLVGRLHVDLVRLSSALCRPAS